MALCEGMQDSLSPLQYGLWSPTSEEIPGDDESMPDQHKGSIYLDSEQSETHEPSRNKLETERNSPYIGTVGHVQPNAN